MEPPYFFLHIPRTAGTTINSILLQHFSPEEIINVYSQEEYQRHAYHTQDELKNIKFITGHLLLQQYDTPKIYDINIRVFTLLREPIARLISEYIFLRTWKNNHLYTLLNDNNISFAEYISSNEKILRYRGKNFITRCLVGKDIGNSAYPQSALEQAKYNLQNVFCFFGIQERFTESILMLGKEIGVKNLLHLKRNALNKKSTTIHISDDEIQLAVQLNKADRELYEFACALFAQRVHHLGPQFQAYARKFAILNEKYQKIAGLLARQEHISEGSDIFLPKDGLW